MTTLNSTSLLLTWEIPDCPNGPISGYGVYYRQANSTQTGTIDSTGYTMLTINETSFIDDATGRFAIISSLLSLKDYTIHVRALTYYNGSTLLGNADVELMEMLDTEIDGVEILSVIPGAYTIESALPSREALLANTTGNIT